MHRSSYVPPHAGWNDTPRVHTPPLGTIQGSPSAEHALNNAQPSPPQSRHGSIKSSRHNHTTSDTYYEDVDPRFTEADSHIPPPRPSRTPPAGVAAPPVPTLLLPGGYSDTSSPDPLNLPVQQPYTHGSLHGRPMLEPGSNSYEDSSTRSDDTHFTSISQRGINPQWQSSANGITARRPPPQRDYLLQGNPDFELPSNRGGRRTTRGGGGPAEGGYAAAGSL